MRTDICEQLGIEFPIFAFSHCRDVVAAVSRAGGLGVLGAVGFSPEQLEVELAWLDEHLGDVPYGVDIVIPDTYEGMDLDMTPEQLEAELVKHVPQQHRDFGAKILADHGVPELPADEKHHELLGWTAVTAAPQVDVILAHPGARLVANALGTPPADVVSRIQSSGRLVGALCGS
ncbi:MAG TPA: nitronate monooxygenase, partial [Acidimicrobiales bacterium]